MADFARSIAFVLEHEGGYVNDPDDPGGETKFGISKRRHPSVDIKNLTIEQAAWIYREAHWLPMRGPDLPDLVGLACFDWWVHSGNWAVKGLQQIVGVTDDGAIGPQTLGAVRGFVHGLTSDPVLEDRRLAEQLCVKRALFAGRWIARKPQKRGKFAPGFMVRFVDLVSSFTLE